MVSAALKLEPLPVTVRDERRTEIALRDVAVEYPSERGTKKTVLSDINLEIAAGEFVVILGETGCGKSTLLRLILGQEFPTAGSVMVDGKPVRRIDARCGYVPQKYSLFPDRTVMGNVLYGPENACGHFISRLTPSFYRERRALRAEAKTYLGRMGLHAQDMSKYPHQLSGGMQQRVAIAQALLMKPPVLLLDEAFSALDPSTRSSLQDQLHVIWSESRPTVIFVTHNTQEALLLGTRLILLGRQHDGNAGGKSVLLDMEIPTSRIPLAVRRKSAEFQDLQEYVTELAHRSSSMRSSEELSESVAVEGNL
ncbi:MAG: ATP-binding cassette domain-containing protein [Terracidiphilus sp.]